MLIKTSIEYTSINSGYEIFRILGVRGSSECGTKFNPLDSKCDDYREICCRLPEWRDVPLEEEIKLPPRPPAQCIKELRRNRK